MHRLICAFVVRIWHKQVFSWRSKNKPHHEKTCLQGLWPGKTQTGLLSYRDQLEFWNFWFSIIILSRQRATKVLIRLRECAGWSAPLLFGNVSICYIQVFLMIWLKIKVFRIISFCLDEQPKTQGVATMAWGLLVKLVSGSHPSLYGCQLSLPRWGLCGSCPALYVCQLSLPRWGLSVCLCLSVYLSLSAVCLTGIIPLHLLPTLSNPISSTVCFLQGYSNVLSFQAERSWQTEVSTEVWGLCSNTCVYVWILILKMHTCTPAPR